MEQRAELHASKKGWSIWIFAFWFKSPDESVYHALEPMTI